MKIPAIQIGALGFIEGFSPQQLRLILVLIMSDRAGPRMPADRI
jgi:hypothetical protein